MPSVSGWPARPTPRLLPPTPTPTPSQEPWEAGQRVLEAAAMIPVGLTPPKGIVPVQFTEPFWRAPGCQLWISPPPVGFLGDLTSPCILSGLATLSKQQWRAAAGGGCCPGRGRVSAAVMATGWSLKPTAALGAWGGGPLPHSWDPPGSVSRTPPLHTHTPSTPLTAQGLTVLKAFAHSEVSQSPTH